MSKHSETLADTVEQLEAYVGRLYEFLVPLQTLGELSALPSGSVILTEVDVGCPEHLVRDADGWVRPGKDPGPRWATAMTPFLPALLLVRGEDVGAVHRPRRAARATDPASSHRAVHNRTMGWDTLRMKALRVFYGHSLEPLTYHQLQVHADQLWGPGSLGESPWKRASELHTDYDPPLIERSRDERGDPIEAPGKYGDLVDAYQITDAGRAMVRRVEPTA